MKILWLNWKDKKHPQAGGAEIVNEELAKRLVQQGHEVIFLVSGFPGGVSEEVMSGYKVIRLGNRWTVYWNAYKFYKGHLKGWPDLVIDEMNTLPFFSCYYAKEKVLMLIHQLCRKIWFYQIVFPVSLVGYILEPIYLRMLSNNSVITISNSTRRDLIKHGFNPGKIKVISVGIEIEPVKCIDTIEKYHQPTMLSLGSIRAMKRTAHQIKAFEIAKKMVPNLRLIVAGDANGNHGEKVLKLIDKSPYRRDIEYFGRIGDKKKTELMQKCHFITVTSVKEGWGLIVTEANSQGTPAIVYDVDGLRDSVRHKDTGIICRENNPRAMAEAIINLLGDHIFYDRLRKNAWMWSRDINFEHSFNDFAKGLGL